MATRVPTTIPDELYYPTGDGKPMAKTDRHRDDMLDLIETLKVHFAAEPEVYVSGNLLLFYQEGDRRKHLSPDVFMVRGVPKRERVHYLVWREGRGPDVVIELTSKSTRREDRVKKLTLYRDVLHVPGYFLFDPYEEYFKPPFQGYRLVGDQYVAIEPVAGRRPSVRLDLHLERSGPELRLYDPAAGRRLPTPREALAESEAGRRHAEAARQLAETGRQQAEADRQRSEVIRQQAEADRQRAEVMRQQAEAGRRQEAMENERLRRELDALRRLLPGDP